MNANGVAALSGTTPAYTGAMKFELSLDASLVDTLVTTFPEATGRDIKGLAKLVAKYCRQKKTPANLEAFKRCAIFRGLEPAHAA
jgi:hypothetical protein